MENTTFTLVHPENGKFAAYFTPIVNEKGEKLVQTQIADGMGDKGRVGTYPVETARKMWTALRKAGCIDLRKWVVINGLVYRREKHGAVSMTVTVNFRSSVSYSRYAPHGYVYMAHEYEERDEGLSADEDSVRIWFRPAAAPRALFAHDCDRCKYLGAATNESLRHHDIYYCKDEDALIGRYGPEGEQYRSITRTNAEAFPEVLWNEALKLYRKVG